MIFDFIWLAFFIFVSLSLPKVFLKGKHKKFISGLKYLILFHFLLGFLYFMFTNNGGGDAYGYWMVAKNMKSSDFYDFIANGIGTRFMEAFNYFPANILGMSFFSNTMLFTTLGAIGVCCFYTITLETIPYQSKYLGYFSFPLILFFPEMHFWSSGIGKDSLLFMCIGLFFYALLKPVNRFPLILIALLLSFALRPHMVLILSASVGVAYLFGGNVTTFQKVTFSLILLGVSIAILPSVMSFVKIDSASLQSISKKGAVQASTLSKGSGSGIDISSYPLPLKMFTFLFRPLFFDARSLLSLISSVENLFLIILVFKAFKSKLIDTFRAAPFVLKGMMFFLILGTFLFSQTLGNLGIMVRMRNMFLPGLLIYCLWAMSYKIQTKRQINPQPKN